jgi:putative FmdB family regulatory protein
MPTYEYLCTECGKPSEIFHRMSDPPAVDCPLCGKPALTKQISAAGFRLKGAGWYETDFKSGSKRNLADGGGTASDAGGTAKTSGSGGDSSSGSSGTASTSTAAASPAAPSSTTTS